MATNKSVVVLTPNGRRQNVKVTPNTTILQVLEEVCQKHKYNADEYDLKHYNRILDANAILRFTGLTNNALLEMVACTKPRKKSDVMIGIQLEDGQRLTGEYAPDTSLTDILKSLCPGQDLDRAVIIYMHREIYGLDTLDKTTLKLLGLTHGRAMLRLIFRDPEQLKTQANIGVPLIQKTQKTSDIDAPGTSSECHRQSPAVKSCSAVDVINLLKAGKQNINSKDSNKKSETLKTEIVEDEPEEMMEISEKTEDDHPNPTVSEDNGTHSNKILSKFYEDMQKSFGEAEFLGERNALIFNQAGASNWMTKDELPDNFYDLTVNDAKILLRDAKRRREELEEAPLLTEAQRQLNQEKRILNQLHKYRCALIRIQFPDQFVLQAIFTPLETVQKIKDFVKNYLADPSCDFTICTTLPKCVLNPEARLVDANLVPSAVVHYSGSSGLKPEIKEKLTDPRIAEFHAIKTRLEMMRQEDNTQNESINNNTNQTPNAGASSSKASTVPKWFNLSSK